MKTTLTEVQLRGLLAICIENDADAVRIEPLHRPEGKPETYPLVPVEPADAQGVLNAKAEELYVTFFAHTGGWSDPLRVRLSGRWAFDGDSHWHLPAEV